MSSYGFHPFGGRVSRKYKDMNLAPDDAYLSYHDVRLTKEDVDCIKSDWLTDNAIAFYEEYLEHTSLPEHPSARITLLRPSMSFLLMQTPDPLTLKSALPAFDTITHVFLPINDCNSVTTAEGGSHWSLLVVSTVDRVAFHYDSLAPSNTPHAEAAAHKLSLLLGLKEPSELGYRDMVGAPQQMNGSDCGVFVCMVMRYLLERKLLSHDADRKVSMSMRGVEIDAGKGRRDMLRLIEGFRKEGRRSGEESRSRSPWGRRSEDARIPPRVGTP